MRVGNVIAAQSTLPICDFISQITGEAVRPVIWPVGLFDQGSKDFPFDKVGILLPKRKLLNFHCAEGERFSWIAAIPSLEDSGYRVRILLGDVDWGLEYVQLKLDLLFTEAEIKMLSTEKLSKEISHKELATFLRLMVLAFAGASEEFAFSSYTATKLRPVLKSGFSNKPLPKEWPPIEIVNLRLPEMIDSAQSEGHRRFRIQFPVIEHLRRLRNEDGSFRLVTVKAHIRGPKDAPLKPKSVKVYKVIK